MVEKPIVIGMIVKGPKNEINKILRTIQDNDKTTLVYTKVSRKKIIMNEEDWQ